LRVSICGFYLRRAFVLYIALLFLIVLGLIALVVLGVNVGTLLAGVRLNLLAWHPSIPVLLLCVISAFLGALLLYVVSTFSARRDAQEIKVLQARVAELEQAHAKSPSGPLAQNFAPPVVPMPGFSPSGSLAQQPFSSGPSPQRPPAGSLSNLSPSSGISPISLPARQGTPGPQPPPTGAPRPPFFQQ
jgi:uncharacterized integral membrane protein